MRLNRYTLHAHGKVNWALNIEGIRPDGYHLVDLILQPISLCDTLTFSMPDTLNVFGMDEVKSEDNLIVRAVRAFEQAWGNRADVRIDVIKRIPMQAGLGGGSADAAATLLALNRIYGQPLTDDRLSCLGASLGADVPFFLSSGCKRARGIGTELEDIPVREGLKLLIVKPDSGMSTAEVYKLSDQLEPGCRSELDGMVKALSTGDIEGIACRMNNMLYPAALRLLPEFQRIRESLLNAGAAGAVMTGSGSAVFGLFREEDALRRAYRMVNDAWPHVHIVKTCAATVEWGSDGYDG